MGKKSRKKKLAAAKVGIGKPGDQVSQPSMQRRTRKKTGKGNAQMAMAIFLSLVAFLIYANTLKNGYAFDDILVVQNNSHVQSGISGIPDILGSNLVAGNNHGTSTMYRPFTLVMFAIEWAISPNKPFIHHFFNCLFYALTAILVFFFLCRIFVNKPLLIPLLGTLLFVVHPIHTEVVANIKSRDELMALFCSLTAFLFLFRYMDKKNNSMLAGMAFFYFSALMFKESAVPILLIFPLLLYFFTSADKKDYFKVIGAAAIVLALQLAIRSLVLQHQTGTHSAFLLIHNSLLGAHGLGEKSASMFMFMGKYLQLLFYPHPLSSDYSYNALPLVSWANPWAFVSLIVYAGLFIICLLRFRKKEAWVFGILFYLVTIFLFSNLFVLIGANIGERFLYTPSLGFTIGIISLLSLLPTGRKIGSQSEPNIVKEKAATSLSFGSSIKKYAPAFIIVLIAGLVGIIKTIDRNPVWKNNFTLYGTDVKHFPQSAPLNYRYGNILFLEKAVPEKDSAIKAKLVDSAMNFLSKAIRIYPDYGDAYMLRGFASYKLGHMDTAESDFRKAIHYEAATPQIFNYMGTIFGQKNMIDSAIRYFNEAIERDHSQLEPYKNLAYAYELKKDFPDAIRIYLQALNVGQDPGFKKDIYSYLAEDYRLIGDTASAKSYLMRAK